MDFVKFAHDRKRMCNAQRGQGEGCKDCPLDQIMDRNSVCSVWCFQNPEKAIEAVEQWAAEHPVKTRQSVFLAQYPEVKLSQDGVITICPVVVSAAYRAKNGLCANPSEKCNDCRRKFWLAEVEL